MKEWLDEPTLNDPYDIGTRVKEVDPGLSIWWDDHNEVHKVYWNGEYILTNPYQTLDGRLITHIRQIDTWNRQYSYNPGRVIKDSEEAHTRAQEKRLEDLSENLSKEALGAVKHDLGVA